jgi:hypothetical protein
VVWNRLVVLVVMVVVKYLWVGVQIKETGFNFRFRFFPFSPLTLAIRYAFFSGGRGIMHILQLL